MSLVSRRKGWCSYWDSLDAIAVHLRRQKAILDGWDDRPPPLRFSSPSYLKRLESVVWRCGLTWDTSIALDVFDGTYVHQAPAAVPHRAQAFFESLLGDLELSRDPQGDRARLERDARSIEALRLQQWNSARDQLSQAEAESQRARIRVAEAKLQVGEAQAQVREAQARLVETERQRDQTQANLDTAWGEIRQASSRWVEMQARLDESHHRERQVQERERQAQERERQAQERERQAQERERQAREQEFLARDRESQAWQRNEALAARLARFELHPILGPALRGRRQLRRMIDAMATVSTRS
jgi:hypothetical protein